jgi:hypothetical protein
VKKLELAAVYEHLKQAKNASIYRAQHYTRGGRGRCRITRTNVESASHFPERGRKNGKGKPPKYSC